MTERKADWFSNDDVADVIAVITSAPSDKSLIEIAQAALRAVDPFKTDAAKDVLAERARQQGSEKFDAPRDDEYIHGELAEAAASYALATGSFPVTGAIDIREDIWPWPSGTFKPRSPRENLVRAGALILAEIERLDRLPPSPERE